MKYLVIVVAIAAIMSFANAADGDVEHSAELRSELISDTHLDHVYKHKTAQRETIEVIIGVQATGNYIPFWGSSYDACRFMTLYLQSEINVAGEIVTLSFMPSGSNVGTFDNVRVNLCHTSVTELSTTFDNNYSGNTPVEVMTVPSLLVGNAGNVWMDWDISFDYNNTDNLVVEIQWNSDNGIAVPIWRTTESVPRRLYAWDDMATTGTVGNQCYYVKLAISTGPPPDHDVGCQSVISPPAGTVTPGAYDVTGRIRNYGTAIETFDCTAIVTDTVSGTPVFTQTVTLTDFPVGGDSNVIFGQVTFDPQSYYFTEIFTLLSGDTNPANDTASVYSTTAISLGDVIFEMDAGSLTADTQLLGIEFDGTYFYVTGGNSGADPNKVYVIDTSGTLIWTMDQPSHSTGWGWRDVTWDNVNLGSTIDTLYASVNTNVDKFSIDLTTGILTYHGPFAGPANPNRALAYKGDSLWFFTASFGNPCYKFSKTNPNIQSVGNSWLMYGAAYDTDTVDGDWVWWHSQDNPGTGFDCQIEQMDPYSMGFTGLDFGYIPTIVTSGIAGGMCFYEGFRGMDVLFCLVQGTPQDAIVGVFVRTHDTGVEEQTKITNRHSFGISAHMANPTKNLNRITYTTTKAGQVSLKVYNNTGRLVETIVNAVQPVGVKTVSWDTSNITNGVYFLRLDAHGETATRKMILVK